MTKIDSVNAKNRLHQGFFFTLSSAKWWITLPGNIFLYKDMWEILKYIICIHNLFCTCFLFKLYNMRLWSWCIIHLVTYMFLEYSYVYNSYIKLDVLIYSIKFSFLPNQIYMKLYCSSETIKLFLYNVTSNPSLRICKDIKWYLKHSRIKISL